MGLNPLENLSKTEILDRFRFVLKLYLFRVSRFVPNCIVRQTECCTLSSAKNYMDLRYCAAL